MKELNLTAYKCIKNHSLKIKDWTCKSLTLPLSVTQPSIPFVLVFSVSCSKDAKSYCNEMFKFKALNSPSQGQRIPEDMASFHHHLFSYCHHCDSFCFTVAPGLEDLHLFVTGVMC